MSRTVEEGRAQLLEVARDRAGMAPKSLRINGNNIPVTYEARLTEGDLRKTGTFAMTVFKAEARVNGRTFSIEEVSGPTQACRALKKVIKRGG